MTFCIDFYKYGLHKYGGRTDRKSIIAFAINVPKYASTSVPSTGYEVTKEVKDLAEKLKPIEFDSSKGPAKHYNKDLRKDDPQYSQKREENYQYLIVEYLQKQLVENYIKTSSTKLVSESNLFDDAASVTNLLSPSEWGHTSSDRYQKTWVELKSIFAKPPYKNLMLAIKYKISEKVSNDQNFQDLDLTAKEAAEIFEDSTKIKIMRSEFGKMTQTKNYITTTTAEQKKRDLEELESQINSNAKVLTKIVNLTIDQMPSKICFKELQKLKVSPTDVNKRAYQDVFIAWKKGLIKTYRTNTAGFVLDDYIAK